jgi:hypothetical protein
LIVRSVNFVNAPKEIGTVPTNELELSINDARETKHPKESGKLPVNLVVLIAR